MAPLAPSLAIPPQSHHHLPPPLSDDETSETVPSNPLKHRSNPDPGAARNAKHRRLRRCLRRALGGPLAGLVATRRPKKSVAFDESRLPTKGSVPPVDWTGRSESRDRLWYTEQEIVAQQQEMHGTVARLCLQAPPRPMDCSRGLEVLLSVDAALRAEDLRERCLRAVLETQLAPRRRWNAAALFLAPSKEEAIRKKSEGVSVYALPRALTLAREDALDAARYQARASSMVLPE